MSTSKRLNSLASASRTFSEEEDDEEDEDDDDSDLPRCDLSRDRRSIVKAMCEFSDEHI